MKRAVSLLTVKEIDEEKRIITGIATTPTPDRVGDIVEPKGAEFQLPIPLLWQHNSREPIGFVTDAKVTEAGIEVTCRIESTDEPGKLKDLLDFAWQAIKKKLVRGLSIGFKELEYSRIGDTYSYRYLRWLWLELSAVTIPANGDATIESVKSIDDQLRAASGIRQRTVKLPGATGPRNTPVKPKEGTMAKKNIAEQISAFEAARKEKLAAMDEILDATGEKGETLDAEQQEEYDGLAEEVKAIEGHLKRLKEREARNVEQAQEIEPAQVRSVEGAAQIRSGIQVKAQPKLAPGIGFARYVKCLGMAKGNVMHAMEIAKSHYGENSNVVGMLKGAVGVGATTSGSWAENLVGDETGDVADFVEFLRPMTILGKFGQNGIPSLRSVPFRTPLLTQTGGGDGYWVGEGKPKPMTSLSFTRTTLEPLKVANIAAATKETLMSARPNAEAIIRDSLATALRARLDTDFISPTKTASPGVSPASITYEAGGWTNSSGNDADAIREDIATIYEAFLDADNPPEAGVWIMSSKVGGRLQMMRNALGQPEFPGVGARGGMLLDMPVITSEYVPTVSAGSYVWLVNASDIYLADEGGITVDMSTEASLEMLDSGLSQDALAGTGASLVSMFQTNSVAFLAERTINWARRRTVSVVGLDTVNWGQPSS